MFYKAFDDKRMSISQTKFHNTNIKMGIKLEKEIKVSYYESKIDTDV